MIPELKIYNTLENKEERFIPIDKNHVRIYACGPTVYNYAHIGNARMAVVNDLLVKVLKKIYPKVTYVSNITDIDDKIIEASQTTKTPIQELTKKFTKIYNQDMSALGVNIPDMQPKATDHIKEMISLASKLIELKHAYEKEGHVLFHVPSFKKYGCLSGRNREEQISGSRVEVAPFKKDPTDFVLWKPSEDSLPGWDSPWGFGRPGWHLECSAMSEKTLGLPFDIHSGGLDLTFPHHENEIAQSCSAHKKTDDPKYFAKYWFHNGFVIVNGEKMSKSIGNIRLVHELNKNYRGEVLRLSLLSSHYRKPLDWTSERITNSEQWLFRFYQKLKIVKDIEINENQCEIPNNIMEALCNDLNMPAVLAILSHMTNYISTETSLDKKKKFKKEIVAVGKLLGLLQESPDRWLRYGHSKNLKDETIDDLIKKRNEARRNKNYILADKIRDELKSKGIEVEDNKNETVWRSEK